MTTPTPTPPAAPPAPETGQPDPAPAPEGSPDSPEEHSEPDDDQDANREAARWRRRLRTAEAERDDLRTQLDESRTQVAELQQSIVSDFAAAAGLHDPELLGNRGHQLVDFLDDLGQVDRNKVTEAATEAIRHYKIRRPVQPVPTQGSYGDPQRQHSSDAFTDAFRPFQG